MDPIAPEGSQHARAASHRSYSKRNRPVTACTECIRRKKKCDREFPCHECLARGVPRKCSYQSASADGDGLESPLKRRNISSGHQAREQSKLLDHIGYLGHGDSAFSAVDELLDGKPSSSARGLPSLHHDEHQQYLKLVELFPPLETVQELVGIFFNEANWYFAVLDRCFFDVIQRKWLLFRQRSNELATQEVLDFAALLMQVLALSMQFLPPRCACEATLAVHSQLDRDMLSERFSEAGEALMNLIGRHNPTIISVQADLLRCAWLKNDGRGAESWDSLRRSLRQAQDLCLHVNTDTPGNGNVTIGKVLTSLWYEEHKRRLWATLFIWESHMSLQLGRPRLINNTRDFTLQQPTDCDFPLDPGRTLLREPQSDERPSLYTLSLVKYRISCLINQMRATDATKPGFKDYRIVQSLHDKVLEILANLPSAARIDDPDTSWDLLYPGLIKQRLQISIVVHSFLVVLHRPHACRYILSRENAIKAALRSLTASHQLFQGSEAHHYKIYTLVFNTIDASIFLAAAAVKYYTTPSTTRIDILKALDQAVERLSVLKSRNIAAKYGERTLIKCIQKYREEWTEQMSSHTDLSSDTIVHAGHNQVSRTATQSAPRPVVSTNGSSMIPLLYDPVLSHDIFAEVTNATVSGAEWPENIDLMSMLDARFDQSDFIWDTLH